MNKTLNCMGQACPLPVVNAKKAFAEFAEDGELLVLVDNETAVKNLTKLAGSSGFVVDSAKTSENAYEVKIQVKAAGTGALEQVEQSAGTVVVISANTMGNGDEQLGKALMKSFIFALTNATTLPEHMIFYNSGAFVTSEGSDSLEDLQNLEKAGVKITTCGTCLNFYGLTEKLQVGTVSNMYDIVETLTAAKSIIRP